MAQRRLVDIKLELLDLKEFRDWCKERQITMSPFVISGYRYDTTIIINEDKMQEVK